MNYSRKKHHKLANFYCIHLHCCTETACIGFCAVSFQKIKNKLQKKNINKIPTYRFTNPKF